jgi:hypothetical protein
VAAQVGVKRGPLPIGRTLWQMPGGAHKPQKRRILE